MTSQPPQPPGGYGQPPAEGGDERRPDGGRAAPDRQEQPGYGQPPYGAQYPQPYHGQPQYGHPQYGQPQYGHPQYGQQPWVPPGYGPPHPQPYHGQQPWVPPGHGQLPYGQQQPAWGQPSGQQQAVGRGARVGRDRGRPDAGDYLVAVCAAAFLLFAVLPWFTFDFGFGFAESINGFDFGLVTTAAVLLVVAAAWALLPAVVDLDLPFPRGSVTVGLTGLACLLTLAEWLSTFEGGFSVSASLTVLAAVAALTVAVLTLLRRLRTPAAVAAGGTAWPSPQQPAQPWQLPGQPPAYGQRPPPAPEQLPPPPAGDPGTRRPGGSTASGAGTDPSA